MSYENFDPKDLLIQSFSTNPSGFVHRIPNGIRAVHLPTGTVVTCDTDRSQHRNRHLALTELWKQVQGKQTYQDLLAERDAALAQNLEQLNNCIAALQIANKRIDKLEKYNLDLANESHNKSDMIDYERSKNAELVAQVEIVRSGLIDARKWVDERNNVCDKAKDFCDTLTDIIESTPTQCLRDIQAEAGRAGFVAGVQYSHKRPDVALPKVIEMVANDYAERVKAGEV